MRTKLGDFLRGLRMKADISLRKMAADLGISPAFLSAVENGKKKMPDSWFALIPKKYNLTDNESDEFKDIAYESFETVELNLAKAKEANKKLAIRFARRFDEIDEKTCEELLEVLENKFKEDSPHE
ncbi:MAG: helix-turn-helix domain-containing protein [Clostridiales bacterium]|nr:helix-turn-helix domain-containing protein [Clostridiales bacterium]